MPEEKKVEDIYKKMSQKEHILARPDTYIGSTQSSDETLHILNDSNKIVSKTILFNQGLFKIFDEIIVNAADSYHWDKSTSKIKVSISLQNGQITVWNDGKGIPIEIHNDEKMYVPELIFGELLTGQNFNDDEKKVTGGWNGYGAKLTNIYSKEFVVEVGDKHRKKLMCITWTNNMSNKQVKTEKFDGQNFVSIKFVPDYERFQMTNLSLDMFYLFKKRVYDLAGVLTSKVKVFFNEELVDISSFEKYAELY